MSDVFKAFVEGYLQRFREDWREEPALQPVPVDDHRHPRHDPHMERQLLLVPVEPRRRRRRPH
jgi:hypothetical protein